MANPTQLKIKRVLLSSLVEDPKNARKHNQRNLDAIKASLEAHAQVEPLVVQAGTSKVIGGNGRLSAMRALGWTHADVVEVTMDDKQAAALGISLNRTHDLSEWDDSRLEETLKELQDSGIDTMSVGFDAGDMEDMQEFHARPFQAVTVSVSDLKPHPQNYRNHPSDQLDHIIKSIKMHGFYRNVVVANDNTILAGHGVVQAVTKMGRKRVPVIRLDIAPDDPRALRVLTSDNEISNLAQVDDRALTELLKGIMGTEDGLSGTGFDEKQLAALAFVTRPESEISDKKAAAEWLGMPQFGVVPAPVKVVVSFRNEDDRTKFFGLIGHPLLDKMSHTVSIWHPQAERRDTISVKFKES